MACCGGKIALLSENDDVSGVNMVVSLWLPGTEKKGGFFQ